MEIKKNVITKESSEDEFKTYKDVFSKVLDLCKTNKFYYNELFILNSMNIIIYNIIYFITDDENKVLAFLMADTAKYCTHIAFFLVDECRRNSNIGTAILDQFLSDHSKHVIKLETNDTKSLKYFIKRNFNVIGKTGNKVSFLILKYNNTE
jgi:hypothetical protein